jgi:hypothetical protein
MNASAKAIESGHLFLSRPRQLILSQSLFDLYTRLSLV